MEEVIIFSSKETEKTHLGKKILVRFSICIKTGKVNELSIVAVDSNYHTLASVSCNHTKIITLWRTIKILQFYLEVVSSETIETALAAATDQTDEFSPILRSGPTPEFLDIMLEKMSQYGLKPNQAELEKEIELKTINPSSHFCLKFTERYLI